MKMHPTAAITALWAALAAFAQGGTLPSTDFEAFDAGEYVTEMTPEDPTAVRNYDTYWGILDGISNIVEAADSAGLATVATFSSGEGDFDSALRPAAYSNAVSNTKYLSVSTGGETLFRTINHFAQVNGVGDVDRTGGKDSQYAAAPLYFYRYQLEDGVPLYFDSMVKFVASPEPPEREGDEKIQIYLHEDQANARNRLVVVSGKVAADGYTLSLASNIIENVEVEDGSWHRLTIAAETRTLANLDTAIYFTIYLDSTRKLMTADGTSEFVGMMITGNGGTSTLSGIGFSGTGAIDEIVITDENPLPDVPEIEIPVTLGEHVSSATVYGQTLTADGTCTVPGDDATFGDGSISAVADDGYIPYIMYNGGEIRLDLLPSTATAAKLIDEEGGIVLSAKPATVTVSVDGADPVGYVSLEDAIAIINVQGESLNPATVFEIVLGADQTLSGDYELSFDYCNFVIDLAGHSIISISDPNSEATELIYVAQSAILTIYDSSESVRSVIDGVPDCTIYVDGELTLGKEDGTCGNFAVGGDNSDGLIYLGDGDLQIFGGEYESLPRYWSDDSEVSQQAYLLPGYSLAQTATSDGFYVLVSALYAELGDGEALVYTGAELEPTLAVYRGGAALAEGDYSVSFAKKGASGTSAVVDAGEYVATVTGAGDYAGESCTVEFCVEQASIETASVAFTPETGTAGDDATPEVEVSMSLGGTATVLDPDSDYTLSWSPAEPSDAGVYTLTVTGTSNFTGTATASFTVEESQEDAATVDGTEYATPAEVVAAANSASSLISFPDSWTVNTNDNTVSYGGQTATFPEYYDMVEVTGGYVLELNELALPEIDVDADGNPLTVGDAAFTVSITLESQYSGLWYRLEQYDPIDAAGPSAAGDWTKGATGVTLSIDRTSEATSGFYRIAVTDTVQ